ncbi:hypothetical protein HJG60_008906 [Phyllostomus discolor]|uniref:Uncharacterized protein n=1 Tax=Phyllostomus discolor TaxID=89673 RepID=A0A833YWS1_9CHIR|nr:hypothetical protein HJG60_008906 [Phyllostomus discolor]
MKVQTDQSAVSCCCGHGQSLPGAQAPGSPLWGLVPQTISLPQLAQGNPDSGFQKFPIPKPNQSWTSPLRGRISLLECKPLEKGACPIQSAFLLPFLEQQFCPAPVLLASSENPLGDSAVLGEVTQPVGNSGHLPSVALMWSKKSLKSRIFVVEVGIGKGWRV